MYSNVDETIYKVKCESEEAFKQFGKILTMKGMEKKSQDKTKGVFGELHRIGDLEKTKTLHVGTGAYMAPEITKSGKYDNKVDIFSLGILMSVVINENNQIYGKNDYSIEFKVASNGNFRPRINIIKLGKNGWLKALMEKCWNHFPQDRPTIDEVFETFKRELNKSFFIEERKKEKNDKEKELEKENDELKQENRELKQEILEMKKGGSQMEVTKLRIESNGKKRLCLESTCFREFIRFLKEKSKNKEIWKYFEVYYRLTLQEYGNGSQHYFIQKNHHLLRMLCIEPNHNTVSDVIFRKLMEKEWKDFLSEIPHNFLKSYIKNSADIFMIEEISFNNPIIFSRFLNPLLACIDTIGKDIFNRMEFWENNSSSIPKNSTIGIKLLEKHLEDNPILKSFINAFYNINTKDNRQLKILYRFLNILAVKMFINEMEVY